MTERSSKRPDRNAPSRRVAEIDPHEVDRLYGLEPVFEPDASEASGALGEFIEITCPWCGTGLSTAVDLTTGDRAWIEDCQVCCRPMRVAIEVDDAGAIGRMSAHRDE